MKLAELDPVQAKLNAMIRNTYLTMERWLISSPYGILYYEYREDCETSFLGLATNDMFMSVYYVEDNGDLTDYTDKFRVLLPKKKKPSWVARLWKFMETI